MMFKQVLGSRHSRWHSSQRSHLRQLLTEAASLPLVHDAAPLSAPGAGDRGTEGDRGGGQEGKSGQT